MVQYLRWLATGLFVLVASSGIHAQPEYLVDIFDTEVSRAKVLEWRTVLFEQVTAESAWRPRVCSAYACGLTQFTPATWGDWAPRTKPSCSGIPETDPACSIRAQIIYNRWLMKRFNDAETYLDQWGFALAGYNGGAGWINREKLRCQMVFNCNPNKYFGHVQAQCGNSAGRSRSVDSCRENTEYPVKILSRAGLL